MIKFILCLLGIFLVQPAFAAENMPLEISAAKSLEWNRTDKTYTARENVIVTQGASTIKADVLVARYTDAKGMGSIASLEAAGHVQISSAPYTAFGDKAIYDVKTGSAILTGADLKVTTPTEVMTAKEKIDYNSLEKRMTVVGGATVVRGTDTLNAEKLNAYFSEDSNGKIVIEKVTADGGVTITTAREKIIGNNGVYDIKGGNAVLTGNVKIMQGKNILQGKKATLDLKSGISRLLADENPNKNSDSAPRVKGVFYPNAQ